LVDSELRVSMGQTVKDIAHHYYAGLKGLSLEEAKRQFEEHVVVGDSIAISALRMAEREVCSSAGFD
jgi:hypothetical protein